MLYLNLNPIFKARQINNPYAFLVKLGIAPHTATKITSNNMHVLRLNHIELICKALFCEPNDLLAYKPEDDHILPENHPLVKLIPNNNDEIWQEQLKTISLSKLKQISKMLADENKNTDK
jgi:DNA-binding Xre family transcriptional regulator